MGEADGVRGDAVTWAAPVLDAVRGIRWPARRLVMAGAVGAHRSYRLGAAVEFTEYRSYRPGDDPRRIDWKLLARSDRAYVRLTEDHATLPTTVLVDASASMAYPVETLGKWQLARLLAVGLAAVAQTTGDPVGLTVFSGAQVVADLAPTTRRGVVPMLAGVLGATTPGVTPGSGLRRTLDGIGVRGRVIVVSDFLQGAEAMQARVGGIVAGGEEVYAVHVVAQEELHPPAQSLLVSDPEDPAMRRPLSSETRRAYQEAFGEWRATLRKDWQGVGATYAMVATDEPPARAVRRIVRT